MVSKLLAVILSLSIGAPAWGATVVVRRVPVSVGAKVVPITASQFLNAMGLHLSRLDVHLGPSLLHPRSAAEYLSRQAIAQEADPAAPVAARLVAGVLAQPAARSQVAAFLKERGGAQGALVAEKLEEVGKAAEGLEALELVGEDLKAGPQGLEAGSILSKLFDGFQTQGLSDWGGVPTGDEFVQYAARRFSGGRLLSGDTPAVAVGGREGPAPESIPDDGTLHDRVALSPLTNSERERVIFELFEAAGAKPEEIVVQDIGRGRNNLYVVKKGRTDRVVVVGGHQDKVRRGHGTIDNWTGATMVVNLYQAMKDVDTEATYIFMAFGREEEGLIGSRAYVRSLSRAEKKNIDSMVNLDTLAVDGTYSWQNKSDRVLLDKAMAVALEKGYDLEEVRFWGGDSDQTSFRRAGIPGMMFYGASDDVIWDIIHSENDTMAHFSLPHYKNAYLLTLALLKHLDLNPSRRGRLARWVAGVVNWVAGWFRSPEVVMAVDPDPVRFGYFHGTSLADVEEVLFASDGRLRADDTYLATRARFSEPYAKSRARQRGGKGIVLEFEEGAGDSLRFSSTVVGLYPAYRAVRELPLSFLTELSKLKLMAAFEQEWAPLPEHRREIRRRRLVSLLYAARGAN
ncbi:MAG: M28 family peptidase [Elusimicrobiota bacterium]